MILTDPPYHVGMTHNSSRAEFSDLMMLKPFFGQVFKEWRRILKPDGLVYCFTDWRTYPFLMPILNEMVPVKNLLVWDKLGRVSKNYSNSHEMIIFAGNNQRKITKSSIIKAKSFNSGAQYIEEKVHPTQKPVDLLSQLIEDGSDHGQVVLDCFMGSGSTGVAALKLNRKFVGIELVEKYFSVAVGRIGAAIDAGRQL